MGIIMKMIKKKEEKEVKKELFLKKALLEAQRNLQDAYTGLANVKDPDLIDCYIYEVNAIMKRYQFLMAQADLLCSNPQTAETSLIAEALH